MFEDRRGSPEDSPLLFAALAWRSLFAKKFGKPLIIGRLGVLFELEVWPDVGEPMCGLDFARFDIESDEAIVDELRQVDVIETSLIAIEDFTGDGFARGFVFPGRELGCEVVDGPPAPRGGVQTLCVHEYH